MAELCTVLVLVLGGWLLVEMVKNRMPQSSDAGADARACATYKKDALIIKSRNPALAEAIEVEASREVNFQYTPDRYVYTGATVGGVHTGGVTKLDGGYTVSEGQKTGSYFLSYKYGKYNEYNNMRWSSKYFCCVSLPAADYKLAKEDRIIRKFVADDEQKKRLSSSYSLTLTEAEAQTALYFVGMSKADAEYLRNWLGKLT